LSEKKLRPTVAVRNDKGWLPLIVLSVIGFIFGAAIVFIIAVHPILDGCAIRQYPVSYYFFAGIFGAIFTLIFGVVYAWCVDVIEEEYLDKEGGD
jgi:uncharacterized membrane protein